MYLDVYGPKIEPMKMPTSSTPMKQKVYGRPFDEHEGKDRRDHADKHGQSRGARDYVHRQSCDGSQERNVQKATAHTDERGDGRDDESTEDRPDGGKREFHAIERERDFGSAPVRNLHTGRAMLRNLTCRPLDVLFLESRGCRFGCFLARLSSFGRLVEEEAADRPAR